MADCSQPGAVDGFRVRPHGRGLSIKNLTIVDDASDESMAIVSEWATGGNQLVSILEQLSTTQRLPKTIRTDNGNEFFGRAILSGAHARGVRLFLTETGKPNQNAYIESFNGRSGMSAWTNTGLPV